MTRESRKRAPTMSDVARLAGVSRTAVSFVLNHHASSAHIPVETRERIVQAAKTLSYRPNLAAKSLNTNRTHTIGFLADQIATTPYAVNILQGAQDAAWVHGQLLLIVNSSPDAIVTEAAIERLLERQVDSIIYATMYHHEVTVPANIYEVPAVVLDGFCADRSLPSVVPDERQGGRTATEVLLSKGHRRVGFVNQSGPVPAAPERLEGYKQALHAYGIPFDERLICAPGTYANGGYLGAKQLMQLDEPPTAIFCFSDFVAMGVYDALREMGKSIPGDVAVVGFDNHELIAAQLSPPLSTMQLPHYEMGKWAVEYLLQPTGNLLPPIQHVIACPYVERQSV